MKTGLALYTGSRACPNLNAVRTAIQTTRQSAREFVQLDLTADLPDNFVEMFNRAVLYLVWHQFFAIATRGIRLPYIPLSDVCEISGVATLTDKDSGAGYKTRLVWMPPALLHHMRHTEPLIGSVRQHLQLDWDQELSPIFFLDEERRATEIRPKLIEDLSRDFFPFPSNTPRRVMRRLLRNSGLSSERIEVYLGHWLERREPWGKWSSFDYGDYFDSLRLHIPEILADLNFGCPKRERKSGPASER
jgi:hypothetical protein